MSIGHAHSRSTRHRRRPGARTWRTVFVSISAIVIALAIVIVATRSPAGRATASPAPTQSAASAPLRIVSVSPADGATGVPSDATVSVHFSVPLGPHSPAPSLAPSLAGSWQLVTPDTYTFVPEAPLVPSSTETVSVPAGVGGVVGASSQALGEGATARFTVASGNTLRLQQLLAELGYLPVSFVPAGQLAAPQEAAQAQQGSFSWRGNEPSSLESLWTVGTPNEITRGAIMAFESQHGMKTDGSAGPAVWAQLLSDAASGAMDPNPYEYVFVDKSLPQRVTVYSNGAPVYSTLANTGVAGAPTASGTFPVYIRYRVTTMSGTNPDGSKYSDPGIPWVSYFNGGDALHGFVRGGYGYPQSDGCVEMPPANAAVVYPLTPIGTLVTVA
jgi:peptidoglycan hydrolase-like protein with peptidoglycan-binding domain